MEDIVLKTFKTKDRRMLGIYVELSGHANIFAVHRRGFLYRINFPYHCDGRFFSCNFALRRSTWKIEHYSSLFQRDEDVGVLYEDLLWLGGKYRFRGTAHFSSHGLVSFKIDALYKDYFPTAVTEHKRNGNEAYACNESDESDYETNKHHHEDREEQYQMDKS